MPYAVKSKKYGTFVGIGIGLVFFTGTNREKGDTVDQTTAWTGEAQEDAEGLINYLVKETVGIDGENSIYTHDDLDAVEVVSGHWKDLEAAGLEIGDMAENELRHMPVAGMA